MCLNYIPTPDMLLKSLETPKYFPPYFSSCAAHITWFIVRLLE